MATFGNHYSRQVQQLEAVLNSKLKHLNLLEKEHNLLVNKEKALQSAIGGIAGPLGLVKGLLQQNTAFDQSGSECHTRSNSFQWSSTSDNSTPSNSSSYAGCVDRSAPSVSSRLPSTASYKGGEALLERLNSQEGKVQRVLQQLRCCDNAVYGQLYTTQLLRKAVVDPERVSGYLNMPKPERLRYWEKAHTQMALLLSKYDADMQLSSGGIRQQLDRVVDELFERITVCALLDPPEKYMSCFMFNVETHEFEPYPPGWWKQVAQGMCLTAEQKAGLKLVWDRAKAGVELLMAEYERMQLHLKHLHTAQVLHNRSFEQEMRRLRALQPALPAVIHPHVQGKQQQQQYSAVATDTLQWSQPLQLSGSGLQQQKQLLPTQQQGQLGLQGKVHEAQLWQLRSAWQLQDEHHCDAARDPADDILVMDAEGREFLEELAAEHEHVQRLEQQVHQLEQQQQVWWGATSYAASPGMPVVPGPAAQEDPLMTAILSSSKSYGALPATAATSARQTVCNAAAGGLFHGQVQQTSADAHAQVDVNAATHVTMDQPGGMLLPGLGPSQAAAVDVQALPGSLSVPYNDAAVCPANTAGNGALPEAPVVQEVALGAATSARATAMPAISVTPGRHNSTLCAAEEVLLQAGSQERQWAEQCLQACNNKIKVLNFCLTLHVINTCTKKQLAAMCVHAHPFVADFLSVCEAFDELGWDC